MMVRTLYYNLPRQKRVLVDTLVRINTSIEPEHLQLSVMVRTAGRVGARILLNGMITANSVCDGTANFF